MSTAEAKKSNATFYKIMIAIALGMLAMGLYMAYVIKAVPKTVANSKAGLFAEFVEDQLKAFSEEPQAQDNPASYEGINAIITQHFSESPWALQNNDRWQLTDYQLGNVHGRSVLHAHYRDAEGERLLLSVVAMPKRNFPKTGGFGYKDAWFFTFGKDHGEAQLPDHVEGVKALQAKGLNLVATNYGNDFYIVLLSAKDSKELARDLYAMSNIYRF